MKQALGHDIVTYAFFNLCYIMLIIEIIFKMSQISKSCYFLYQYTLKLQINERLDFLVTQNLIHCNPYGNKCTCGDLSHKVMLITSRDIAVF